MNLRLNDKSYQYGIRTYYCGFAAAGLALSAIGTIQSMRSASAEADAKNAIIKQQTVDRVVETELGKEDKRRELRSIIARGLTRFASNGISLSSGAVDAFVQDAGAAAGRDLFNLDFNKEAALTTGALNTKATNLTAQNKKTSALFNFGSSVFGAAKGGAFSGLTSSPASSGGLSRNGNISQAGTGQF